MHKTVPAFFLIMCYWFFIAIIRQALRAYFSWKQLKVDYSKNIWKEENRGHSFASWLAKYKLKKNIENYNPVGAGAHYIYKLHILKKFGLSTFKEIL